MDPAGATAPATPEVTGATAVVTAETAGVTLLVTAETVGTTLLMTGASAPAAPDTTGCNRAGGGAERPGDRSQLSGADAGGLGRWRRRGWQPR